MSSSSKRLGKYLLKSKLGQGGMGIVYAALDERLRRDVALKVLPKAMAANEDAVKRFFREARTAARVSHPNVVSIYDVDQIDGYCFIAMELLSGGSVQDLLADGPLEWRRATQLIADACAGLEKAHQEGLIHRDIKPSNLMLSADGLLKLTDFGLVKDIESSQRTMTQAGSLIGTPHYMSPEQCQGEPVDPRSDLYALGATWYALLTGRPPFAELDRMQAMFAHCSKPLPDPRQYQSAIPSACVDVLNASTAKLRVERFQTAGAMRAALIRLLENPTTATVGDLSPPPFVQTELQPPSALDVDVETQTELRASSLSLPPGLKTAVLSLRNLDANRLAKSWRIGGGIVVACVTAVGLWFAFSRAPESSTTTNSEPKSASNNKARSSDPTASSFPRPFALETYWEPQSPGAYIRSLCFTTDSQRILTSHYDGHVREWLLKEQKLGRTFSPAGSTPHLRAVAIDSDQSALVAGGDGRELFVWNYKDGSLRQTIKLAEGIEAFSFRPDGKHLAVGGESSLTVFEKQGDEFVILRRLTQTGSRPVGGYMTQGVQYSADGRWLVASTWDQSAVGIWDAQTYELKTHRSGLAADPRAIAISPHESAVAVGLTQHGGSGGVVWWHFEKDNAQPQTLIADSASGASLAFSPDGRTLFSGGGWEQRVQWIDPKNPSYKGSIESIRQETKVIALSPDSRFLVAGGGDENTGGRLRIWSVTSP